MDLLQTVRKEGSRGGVNFSWSDVKDSAHRENYLGHSLMAPVGRWQKNKDLSWYAKADDAELSVEERAEKERVAKREELRKVKEAEEDAMARALGLPVPERRSAANETPLGMDRSKQAEVNKALKEALGDVEQDGEERAVGLGSHVEDGEKMMTRPRKPGGDQDRGRGIERRREGIDTDMSVRARARGTLEDDHGAGIDNEMIAKDDTEIIETGREAARGTSGSIGAAVDLDHARQRGDSDEEAIAADKWSLRIGVKYIRPPSATEISIHQASEVNSTTEAVPG